MITRTILCLLLLISLYSCSLVKNNRETLDFNSDWKFLLSNDVKKDYAAQNIDDSGWRKLDLPHDWSIEADFDDKNPATPGGGALPGGIGWYRKTFYVDKNKSDKLFFIDFDGVYWNSEVWINGKLLGKRLNGYISFRYELTPYLNFGKENVISVKADNSQQPNSRWYSGSGIYRNVRLELTNPVHVDLWGTYITTTEITNDEATLKIQTKIQNGSQDNDIVIHQIVLDAKGNVMARTSSKETVQEIKLKNPVLWSIENPYLYTVVTKLESNNKILDEYRTNIGIRSFEFDAEKGFILNGKQVKINGVCNHHDLGCLGVAVNKRAIERQLELLKAMGCNGIRCSHNPPAPELLDLCDRMGFIVMDEAFDMWRKKKSPYDYSQFFADWYERDLTDLILRDRNHPSVFMWSIGNEVLEQWTHAGTDTLDLKEANILLNQQKKIDPKEFEFGEIQISALLTQRLAEIVKTLDSTRPVTAGCNETRTFNHLFKSNALDVIGFNYHTQDYAAVKQNFPGKPFIGAETVSGLMSRGYYQMPSDSIYVWPERWDKPFSQPVNHCSSYDNCHVPWGNTHEESLKLIKKSDFIAGQYIWTGFDYLGEPTPFWWPSRSSYFGIIDLAGFPKDVYYMYQSEWTNKDVLHIFPHWNWTEGQPVDIWAYYNNADEVELFLNGKSLGVKKKEGDQLHVAWRVSFEKGTIKAISRKNGKEVLVREIKTAGDPVSIRLTADRETIAADGNDLSFITVEVLDKNGNVVPIANNLISFSVSGNGAIVGTDNGDPTDHQSLKKPQRHLFNGKALVVVQAGTRVGEAVLKATSANLTSQEIKLKIN